MNAQLSEEMSKSRDKIERLLHTIDELQASDSSNQLQARRAERELREEKEKALRLERELEGWKALRVERSSLARSGTLVALSEVGTHHSNDAVGVDEPRRHLVVGGGKTSTGPPDIPQRRTSTTKGFL